MVTPVSVSLSGPAFSFLLYENSKCRFQQEGFLLGKIIRKETKTITDNDQQQVNVSITVKINSVMPLPQTHYFYNGVGKVDEHKLREFLGNQFDTVVAWYKYQKISSFKFTLRNKTIHRQLTELFKISPELFTCCLLINEISDNGSTHLYSQAFMRYHNGVYDKLSIHIPNLSEPNNTYKESEPASDTFNKILKDLKIDKNNAQGLVVISKIQSAVQKHVDTVIKDLSEAEKYLHELEEEVKQLEMMKKLKQLNEVDIKEPQDTKRVENVFSEESSPEPQSKSNRPRDPIDSTSSQDSQENSPVVQRKATRGARKGQG
ncbi:hypothetical protein NQ317_014343 [Molorchus minor]|uniref:BRISC complex subunit FAM175B helical domain-containing protein n=1 Tax=Molorchus minor TaxID=1323400 RepID=A0ABQ9K6C0_9CUCU|nr:hypothetical protein NQ317_014343 [Molorchus minor]